ncbi:hypothetical protein [Bacillus toyonensis]|uniref:hypothetical protein n=1 Tax=Bacillus toyonensis TaxID=155322 RepID=UPI002E1CED54|nr:hypothetical protein [Bacillus toyonensis]
MYKYIVEYESRKFVDSIKECNVIKEIESETDMFGSNLIIQGKVYSICSSSLPDSTIGVEEITLDDKPKSDVRCEGGVKCPFCNYVDYDAFELVEDRGEEACGTCGSEFTYVRYIVTNKLGECEEVVYFSSPVKLNKPIAI